MTRSLRSFAIAYSFYAAACLSGAEPAATTPFLAAGKASSVQWQTWSPETQSKAIAEDKPLFFFVAHFGNSLSRAMGHETFANATISETLNQSAIPVLIDSHEEPDLAAFLADMAQTHFGADDWPICLWTTARLEPIAGGGYFPPTDDWGGQGFISLARKVSEQWSEAREETENAAAARTQPPAENAYTESITLSNAIEDALRPQPDAQSLKATTMWSLARSLAELPADHAPAAIKTLEETIRQIARNSGFDAIEGGFFLGSNDAQWRLPLFQKSTADQAMMLMTLQALRQRNPDPLYDDLVRLTADFIQHRLIKENGLARHYLDSFAQGESAEDLEGAYYLFDAETVQTLPAETASIWSLTESGNLGPDTDILGLYTGMSLPINTDERALSETVSAERQALQALRAAKPGQPAVDHNAYVAANALLVSAFAGLSEGSSDAARIETAQSILAAIETHCMDATSGRLFNADHGATPASSQAYVYLIAAYLDLHRATQEERFVTQARKIDQAWRADERFDSEWPPSFRIADQPEIWSAIIRDQALPSVAAIHLRNTRDFARLDGVSAPPAPAIPSKAGLAPARYLSLFLETEMSKAEAK